MSVLLLPACFVARVEGGPVEQGPEQFVFTMVPGEGAGEAAHQAVDEMGENVQDAEHLAFVETPLGRVDLYRYSEVTDVEELTCRAVMTPGFGSAGCGLEGSGPGDDEVSPAGISVDGGWGVVEVTSGPMVARLSATADDGTVYRSNLLGGTAIIVYPLRRGELTLQGLNDQGQPVGSPARTETPEGLDQGEPPSG